MVYELDEIVLNYVTRLDVAWRAAVEQLSWVMPVPRCTVTKLPNIFHIFFRFAPYKSAQILLKCLKPVTKYYFLMFAAITDLNYCREIKIRMKKDLIKAIHFWRTFKILTIVKGQCSKAELAFRSKDELILSSWQNWQKGCLWRAG